MCGRFTLRTPAADLARLFHLPVPELPPRYNIAPTQDVAAIRSDARGEHREFALLRWGLVPFWADDPKIGYKTINARAETVAVKPAFRSAFSKRRCLILADGFYEWEQAAQGKQPYLIHRQDDRPFAMAGLWEHWEKGERLIESCTIIVTEANDLLAPIHDRMPVIVSPDDYDLWLDPASGDRGKLQQLLQPADSRGWERYPVSTVVNNARHETADCIRPVE